MLNPDITWLLRTLQKSLSNSNIYECLLILSIQPDENNRISTHVYSFISDLMEFFPFILVFKSNVLDHNVLDHIIFVDTSNAR